MNIKKCIILWLTGLSSTLSLLSCLSSFPRPPDYPFFSNFLHTSYSRPSYSPILFLLLLLFLLLFPPLLSRNWNSVHLSLLDLVVAEVSDGIFSKCHFLTEILRILRAYHEMQLCHVLITEKLTFFLNLTDGHHDNVFSLINKCIFFGDIHQEKLPLSLSTSHLRCFQIKNSFQYIW